MLKRVSIYKVCTCTDNNIIFSRPSRFLKNILFLVFTISYKKMFFKSKKLADFLFNIISELRELVRDIKLCM